MENYGQFVEKLEHKRANRFYGNVEKRKSATFGRLYFLIRISPLFCCCCLASSFNLLLKNPIKFCFYLLDFSYAHTRWVYVCVHEYRIERHYLGRRC